MSGRTFCPHCQTCYGLKVEQVGRPTKCKKCNRTFTPTPSRQIDRYETRGELGRGTFGIVYRAWDEQGKREVALKVLRAEVLGSADAVERFLRETEVLAQIVHPNIVPILGRGQVEDSYYAAFPLIPGRPLSDLITDGRFRDPRQSVQLAIKLLRALHYVYDSHGILHRDVKPSNIMLLDADEEALYLMDFGLAVCHGMERTHQTAVGSVLGTPAYMPPEQAAVNPELIGHGSDIYSAGAVLYHLLTGTVPFRSQGFAILADILATPVEPPSQRRRGLDPHLDPLVLRALAKKPQDRYATALEFAQQLQRWVRAQGATRLEPAVAVREQGGTVAGRKERTVAPDRGRGPEFPPAAPEPEAGPVGSPAFQTEAGSTGKATLQPVAVARTTLAQPPEPPPLPRRSWSVVAAGILLGVLLVALLTWAVIGWNAVGTAPSSKPGETKKGAGKDLKW
jgi:hypothetical protein